ncbi:MAG: DUF2203 family protein [Planctomycetota bacterium]|nr:MAG: DUF2203 family protein [Planctomycetota bacterium]
MDGMEYRYFTVAEARELLPQVRRHMNRIQAAKEAILKVSPEQWPALEKAMGNGGAAAVTQALQHTQVLERAVRSILKLGVQIKDLDKGLLDFPSLREGREVSLCWMHGEDDIRWWHETDAGFAGRQPLDE